MIDSGESGRYVLYAIGEITLVVIGILIALSINNANERRIQKKKVIAYLTEIHRELSEDIKETNIAYNGYSYQDSLINIIMMEELLED